MHAFDALGNEVRRNILLVLRDRPLAVHELARRFHVTRPAISRHLRVLESAGLVETRAEGARSIYSVRVQGFETVREYVDSFWEIALARLGELAEEDRSRKRTK